MMEDQNLQQSQLLLPLEFLFLRIAMDRRQLPFHAARGARMEFPPAHFAQNTAPFHPFRETEKQRIARFPFFFSYFYGHNEKSVTEKDFLRNSWKNFRKGIYSSHCHCPMKNTPNHIAIIPDGNRRWAKKHGIVAWRGIEKGAERFEEVAAFLFDRNVPYVTFWAGSEDNLTKRSSIEVKFLVSLLRDVLLKITRSDDLVKNKVKFKVFGRWDALLAKNQGTAELKKIIHELEEKTKKFQGKNLTFLFGYDGRQEMVAAIEKIKTEAPKKVDYDTVSKALWTGMLPPVDLVIRTGGEPHWSAGFMMWHTANAQMYFTEKLWPDFKKTEAKAALEDFSRRGRRFGK